jgi:N-formylglutamate deformylase
VSEPFILRQGTAPLLVSFPHDGTEIPLEIAARMTPAALARPDTDWHVARLYDFVAELGASTLQPRMSRYVVDLNRDPSGAALYPGADNTSLVPTSTFERQSIYQPGQEPDAAEIAERIERWFLPYHAAIEREIRRLLESFGVAVVFDAHSIRSEVPRFFDGVLPDLNLGTASGESADETLASLAFQVLSSADGYSAVRDARFKGGFITRRYGRPARGVHAVQLELAQKNYMHEAPPYDFDEARADRLRPVLREFVGVLLDFARQGSR